MIPRLQSALSKAAPVAKDVDVIAIWHIPRHVAADIIQADEVPKPPDSLEELDRTFTFAESFWRILRFYRETQRAYRFQVAVRPNDDLTTIDVLLVRRPRWWTWVWRIFKR